MVFTFSLACSCMMMDCPRCGFAQPKDRYCASCGLDVDAYVAKPKPLWVRLAQNPNLHLSLIGALILLVVGYIFYSQRDLVSREVGNLLNGLPLSSRDAGAPSARAAATPEPTPAPIDNEDSNQPTSDSVAETATATTSTIDATVAVDKTEVQKVEVSAWEIPHETMTALLKDAEKAGESGAGKAYLWNQGNKVAEAVQTSARRLAPSRSMALQVGSQISSETPATASEAFQFGIYFQVTKGDSKDVGIKWEIHMVLTSGEVSAENASQAPAVKALTDSSLKGEATLSSTSALLILLEPTTRTPREEYLTRAGEGPWSVFTSEEFRGGITDWVLLVQAR